MHTDKWTPTSHIATADLTKYTDQLLLMYCKLQITKHAKNSDTYKSKYPKIETVLFNYRVIGSKDADRMSNNVDPDQTVPVCSDQRSKLFIQVKIFART